MLTKGTKWQGSMVNAPRSARASIPNIMSALCLCRGIQPPSMLIGNKKWNGVQGSAKRRGLGCVNSLPGSAWL